MQQPPPLPPQNPYAAPPPLGPPVNPYAAPAARVDDAPTGDELELADRGIRLVGKILDSIIIAIPVGLVAFVLALVAGLSRANGGGSDQDFIFGVMAFLIGISLVGMLIWNFVWLHRYGQTIAKRLLKIRIVRSDGSRCGLLRVIFARWLPVTLLGAIPVLGYVAFFVDSLMIFRDDRRCLHDLIADTIVVKA